MKKQNQKIVLTVLAAAAWLAFAATLSYILTKK